MLLSSLVWSIDRQRQLLARFHRNVRRKDEIDQLLQSALVAKSVLGSELAWHQFVSDKIGSSRADVRTKINGWQSSAGQVP